MKIYMAGLKKLSLIDVKKNISCVIWLCMCNLKCPYCHNYRIADGDPKVCKWIDIDLIVNDIEEIKYFIDYVHITGGEPLLQLESLKNLLSIAKERGLNISIDTNAILSRNLEVLLNHELVDHIATDIKIPFKLLTGVNNDELWSNFLRSIEIIKTYDKVTLELRIPISKLNNFKTFKENLNQVYQELEGFNNYYIVIYPILKNEYVQVRNPKWAYYNPSKKIFLKALEVVRKLFHGVKIYEAHTGYLR